MSGVLVLTHSGDRTADYLCERLSHRRDLLRLDTDALPDDLDPSFDGAPMLQAHGRRLSPGDVSAVWYRRPRPLEPPGSMASDPHEERNRSLEWAEALEGVLAHISEPRWVNHPARNALASHKVEQLTRARSFGLHVPRSIVTRSPDRLRSLWNETDGSLIAKPLASGYIEREDEGDDTAIYTSSVTEAHVAEAHSLNNCPTLFQERIDKRLDVRVTVVDDDIVAIGLVDPNPGGPRLDIRRDDMRDLEYCHVPLPDDVRDRTVALLRSYGLRFSALDFIIDASGRWVFLEVNPNGQWAWLDLIGGAEIWTLFDRAFDCP